MIATATQNKWQRAYAEEGMKLSEKIKIPSLFETLPPTLETYASECEYPWELIARVEEIVGELVRSAPKGYREIEKGILVGDNVSIAASARIEPPAIIGANSEIRHCAYLRGNVIVGENCVIGNSSELKSAILFDRVQVPHYNYVGNSMLGRGAHLGAGAICSNLKSDGSNVIVHTEDKSYNTGMRKLGAILGDGAEIGCGCVLAPGCIVGKNTTAYPLTFLRGTIPENSIVKSMNEIVEKRIK
jgi:NDP-sugar pyrophosphorylase family protein